MRLVLLQLFSILLMLTMYSTAQAQYGEHGKPRMLLIQTNSELTPPNDDESDLIRKAVSECAVSSKVMTEDFMSARSSYTVMIKEITPLMMPNDFYDDLKIKIRKYLPRSTFQEVEFETAYKLLNKKPVIR